MKLQKSDIIILAEAAGFRYHNQYDYASFAPGGTSIRLEGFRFGLEEISYSTMEELLNSAVNCGKGKNDAKNNC